MPIKNHVYWGQYQITKSNRIKTNFVLLATIIVMMQSICNIFLKPNIYF